MLFACQQYCDVHIPKIQEMLEKIPTPLSGAICNEKTGWLPSNFDDNCRELLNEAVSNLIRTQQEDVGESEFEGEESFGDEKVDEEEAEGDDESFDEDDVFEDDDDYDTSEII